MNSSSSKSSPLLAYMQLFRLPNVFTAMADVMMGYLFTHGQFDDRAMLGLLLASSSLMYIAGMVLNDVYDQEVDSRERPHRPIPSGRVHPGFARTLGYQMLLLGLALGGLVGYATGDPRPPLVAFSLAVMVVLYDRVLKQTAAGPLAMGGCRFLNVLLGMSIASLVTPAWLAVHYLVAAGVGVYIVGVTWFARTEAKRSNRVQLLLAIAVMLCGLGTLAYLPNIYPEPLTWPRQLSVLWWYLTWGVLALHLLWRAIRAVANPVPTFVQQAVKQCLLSLIVIDALVACPVGGIYALLILILVFPNRILGHWVYST